MITLINHNLLRSIVVGSLATTFGVLSAWSVLCYAANTKSYSIQETTQPLHSIGLFNAQCQLRKQLNIEVAADANSRTRGLMHRRELIDSDGMLFIWDKSDYYNMWMKNTPLSLDMIFLNHKGQIIQIERNTTPYSLKVILARKKTTAILEILAGHSQLWKLKVGDWVRHPFLSKDNLKRCKAA